MKQGLAALCCDFAAPEGTASALLGILERGSWVHLVGPQGASGPLTLPSESADWPEGPGLVLSTGGSSGGRSLCLHPLANLERSAEVCRLWLQGTGCFQPLKIFHTLNTARCHQHACRGM